MREIIGNTTATPNPRPDWNQNDETKADYIKNKPSVDQTYTPDSANAQSGVAVAEAIEELRENLSTNMTGGIISGDLSIQGNLSVAGTTTTKDTETLMVQDNAIVANSNGVKLIEEAGFIVKTDETNAYGIMYDPVGDGVKIGLGTFDEDGKFEYIDGEDQFLATRADDISDGHTVVWDGDTRQFVDSGVDHSEYVKFTDYATASKAGVLMVNDQSSGMRVVDGQLKLYPASPVAIGLRPATSNATNYNETSPITLGNLNLAVLSALTDDKKIQMTDEEKASACATIGAVGKEDYASETMAGVVKPTLYGTGGISVSSSGELKIVQAVKLNIEGRQTEYRPITPKNMDYALKVAISTNTETLTDEEKTSALAWLGAVAVSEVSAGSYEDKIVRRITNGNINVPVTPLNDFSATAKKYVDGKFAELLARIDNTQLHKHSVTVDDGTIVLMSTKPDEYVNVDELMEAVALNGAYYTTGDGKLYHITFADTSNGTIQYLYWDGESEGATIMQIVVSQIVEDIIDS